jgi:hypothetical protein
MRDGADRVVPTVAGSSRRRKEGDVGRQTLVLSDCKVMDAELKELKVLKSLQTLNLIGTSTAAPFRLRPGLPARRG